MLQHYLHEHVNMTNVGEHDEVRHTAIAPRQAILSLKRVARLSPLKHYHCDVDSHNPDRTAFMRGLRRDI